MANAIILNAILLIVVAPSKMVKQSTLKLPLKVKNIKTLWNLKIP
jgi:hypothetical protein